MKNLVRSLLPQKFINIFYHLPKALLANIFYDFPTRGLKVVGVTGTDGKTTTVNMIYHILKSAGKKVSMVSTINAYVAGKSYDTGFHVTSPDPFMVQRFAKVAKDNGDEYLILEVTSHGLDQYRFWGIKFEVGVITNITHEHLDYHQTFENYKKTKLKFLEKAKFAVINQNIFIEMTQSFTFGFKRGDFNQEKVGLKLKLAGNYNTENALAALAVSSALGIDQKIARKSVESFEGIVGRMEEIQNNKGLRVVVDFAHTPNALEQVLKTLRVKTKGRLISVFGCAGYRDVKKRPLMGQISAKLANITIITTEDPRGELDQINKEIISGAVKVGAKEGQNLFVIKDRQKAINFAIQKLGQVGDVVGIFGKGHEKSINLDGKKEIAWSDQKAAVKAINGR